LDLERFFIGANPFALRVNVHSEQFYCNGQPMAALRSFLLRG
jgi:hypothetical protein